MLSTTIAIGLFAIISIMISAIFFVATKESEKLKKFRIGVFVVVSMLLAGAYTLCLNHVYILNKADKSYDHKIILFPSSFTFDNKEVVSIKPKFNFGGATYVINNSPKDAIFRVAVYGSARAKSSVALPKNKVTYVRNKIDYIFSSPPNSVRIKGSGTTKGYISYYNKPVRVAPRPTGARMQR